MLRVVSSIMLVAVMSWAVPVRATQDDPDTEIARRYFAEGSEAYLAGDYRAAIERFEAARRVKPMPAFDYNLGRCHDRLDQPAEAIEAYRRYLAAQPSGDQAREVRARIGVLQPRVVGAPIGGKPVYKKWWFWTILGGVVVVGATTAAVLLTVPSKSWQTTQPIGPGVSQALVRF